MEGGGIWDEVEDGSEGMDLVGVGGEEEGVMRVREEEMGVRVE